MKESNMRNILMAVIIIVLLYTAFFFVKNNFEKVVPFWITKDYESSTANR